MQHNILDNNNKRNILLNLCYDGKNYHGWQIQKNAITVQEVLQNSIYKVIGEYTDIKGCSRTDTGVHANSYYVNFKCNKLIKCENLKKAINNYLPKDIAVCSCKEVHSDFHARYDCTGKEYIYKIWNDKVRNPFLEGYAYHYWYDIDENLLNEEGQLFVGTHDFTSFCTADKRENKNMIRTVKNFSVKREKNVVLFKIEADGFLYNMVRIMVGTLLKIQQGKIKQKEIPAIIDAKDRSKAGGKVVPYGLYLNKVFYDNLED